LLTGSLSLLAQFVPDFGSTEPELNTIPLSFILIVTGIKDAIEDWRRTTLDNELNNLPVHRLVNWDNVNVADEYVSRWRRIKKATTRTLSFLWRQWKRRKARKGGGGKDAEEALDDQLRPVDTKRTSITTSRMSFRPVGDRGEQQEEVEMTPVQSPLPRDDDEFGDADGSRPGERPATAFSYEGEGDDGTARHGHGQATAHQGQSNASVMDPLKPTSGDARFKRDFWKNLRVGDFVRIYNDDPVPADIAILSTSDPDGACYIETKNLDGETNLKVRQALHCGRSIKHARDCERAEFIIESEVPQPNLYQYSGVARWKQRDARDPEAPATDMAEPITINNLLLRGCSVKNTEWVLGVVVFTGQETKIMLNSGFTPRKRSRISRELNKNVLYNFGILFVMCFLSGAINGVAWAGSGESLDFFEYGSIGGTPAVTGLITFWAAVVLFQNLVPISLYISVEIIKTAQAFFIYSDTEMYYEKIDYPCTPKSWNISDDVGQVEYIFSDKTGTLTQNVMEFKKCTINGIPYGEAYTEAQAGIQKRQGIDVEVEAAKAHKQIAHDRETMLRRLRTLHPNPYLDDDELTFVAPDFAADLDGESGEEQKRANEGFMLALALCHTVITERTPGDPPRIEFKAQSPDEAALVATARDCGFTVLGRSGDGIILNVMGEEREYTVLNTLEFNSTRKRMSAIIRMPDGRIILFCKGADSVIYSRLKRGEQPQLRKATAEHLEMFAREGLRTLCVAQRELGEEEYRAWNREHDEAAASIQGRDEKLEAVSDAIERDLTLLGGTAIEDRLQDGVPDTIEMLGKAGIKLWVLTGDKVETAINIGFSCNLLDNSMDMIVIKVEDESVEAIGAILDQHLKTFNMTGSDAEMVAARKDHRAPPPGHAIVIDGDALKLVLDEQNRQKFLLLCTQCKSVLCCRVSPSQKAAVVQMVKDGLDVMTLSVGDGANDVAMIQKADVGVGIAGEEGRQAVMSSDYAIGQFRFLQRLVLVHGRWSYRRLGETTANFFYKVREDEMGAARIAALERQLTLTQNMVWTFAIFWYQIYINFDCAYIFDYSYILCYNLVFTAFPIIFMGILDQDVSDKVSLAVPQLYRRGIERAEWTETKFWYHPLPYVRTRAPSDQGLGSICSMAYISRSSASSCPTCFSALRRLSPRTDSR
jgi:phospholipid-translocating ATPase